MHVSVHLRSTRYGGQTRCARVSVSAWGGGSGEEGGGEYLSVHPRRRDNVLGSVYEAGMLGSVYEASMLGSVYEAGM